MSMRFFLIIVCFAALLCEKEAMASGADPEECMICSTSEKNMFSYYEGMDSLGVIHWNSLSLTDSCLVKRENYEIPYADGGKNITSFGENFGTISVEGHFKRRYSEVHIFPEEEDRTEKKFLKNHLCEVCLKKAEIEEMESEDMRDITFGYSLVDFYTGKIYFLPENSGSFFIRDYLVRFEAVTEDSSEAELFLAYLPEQ